MKLSVIITCYNREKTIARAIDSVLYFGIKDMEVIIVDDGSTDKSLEIINSYTDKRIRKFLSRHFGMMETYAFALGQVRGDYFTFCDCDDYWFASVERQLSLMRVRRYRFTVTRAITEKDGVTKIMEQPIEQLRKGLTYDNLLKGKANIHAPTYMIHTKTFNRLIDFSKFLKFNTWDYPICLMWIQTMPIHYLDFYTAYFVIGGESVTNTRSRIRRFKLIMGYMRIKLYFIFKYGCKWSTALYLVYKETRNIYSIIFKRWQK
jgi:glycosyltransferase involved in cell wall biosynthesis